MGWCWSWPVSRNAVCVHQGPMQFGFCVLDKKGQNESPNRNHGREWYFASILLWRLRASWNLKLGTLGQQASVYGVRKASLYSSMSEYTGVGQWVEWHALHRFQMSSLLLTLLISCAQFLRLLLHNLCRAWEMEKRWLWNSCSPSPVLKVAFVVPKHFKLSEWTSLPGGTGWTKHVILGVGGNFLLRRLRENSQARPCFRVRQTSYQPPEEPGRGSGHWCL